MGALGRPGYGPEAYGPVRCSKLLLYKAWHSLSDEALRMRLDFMVITGFEHIPDATTICRFRNLLIKQGLMGEVALSEVNNRHSLETLKWVSVKEILKGDLN